MKYFAIFSLICIMLNNVYSQEITTNRNAVGMEHNMLFNAKTRYTVTQTGSAKLYLDLMFDGKFSPSYTATAPSFSDSTVIEISGLPKVHIQAGAWVGWSTRYWPAKRFKIEGYDEYYGNGWTVFADYRNKDFSGNDFIIKCKPGSYTKLRYTFYEGTGTDGRLGVSELYFIHPEATTPYNGLFLNTKQSWQKEGSNIYYKAGDVGVGTDLPEAKLEVKKTGTIGGKWNPGGSCLKLTDGNITLIADGNELYSNDGLHFGTSYNKDFTFRNVDENGITNLMIIKSNGDVGIGTTNPGSYKLAVKGTIGAKEVVVTNDGWSDFVFEPDYNLMTLADLRTFIQKNKHLPEVPTAKEVEENGISVGEMNAKLLQKIEELTLYLVQKDDEIQELRNEIDEIKKSIK